MRTYHVKFMRSFQLNFVESEKLTQSHWNTYTERYMRADENLFVYAETKWHYVFKCLRKWWMPNPREKLVLILYTHIYNIISHIYRFCGGGLLWQMPWCRSAKQKVKTSTSAAYPFSTENNGSFKAFGIHMYVRLPTKRRREGATGTKTHAHTEED